MVLITHWPIFVEKDTTFIMFPTMSECFVFSLSSYIQGRVCELLFGSFMPIVYLLQVPVGKMKLLTVFAALTDCEVIVGAGKSSRN